MNEHESNPSWLLADFDDAAYLIRVEDVLAVTEASDYRSVPGTPRAVLGLTEWRGRLYTVVDLAGLLDHEPVAVSPGLIVLGPRYGRAALLARAHVRLLTDDEVGKLHRAPQAPVRLDPERLLRGVERGVVPRAG